MLSELDFRVRHAIYRTFAEGGIPLSATLANTLGLPLDDIRHAYARLHEAHALVLDPQTSEVRMALPFSAVATPHRVICGDRSWFANCAWDAFAIPPLMQCKARVESACADCDMPMAYQIEGDDLRDAHGVVHFAVPAARWWDDIGFT
jgi:Alkylmercury lyase